MNDDDRDRELFGLPHGILTNWWGFASPVGLAILLIGLGGFLVLLAEAVAIPLSLFR
ncbi:MAG: hypothetical protein ABSC16_11235 [Candidatus Dormibacteria bacterium]|jgi:hypothetical protein